MLRYIHQFVQTFLREASKTRPKSRKSSRSSIDLAKDRSTVKPEILAIGFNNEGPEAERSKEILELKRTYSLLMKKFVNPKLDLMTNAKSSSDINFLSLKGKQELIRSMINRIFYDSTEQHKQLEGSSKDLSEVNVKATQEESSVGWSGQRTSKLAANPMVETSSKSNNITSALFSFPETEVEPSRKNVRQTDKFLKHRLKSENFKDKNVETEQHVGTELNIVVGSDLRTSEISREINPQHVSIRGTTNENVNDERLKETITEYKEDKICSENGEKSFLSEDSSKEKLQPSLNMELNSHSEINEESSNLYRARKDLTQYNQKTNINIIRSITKVDKNKTAKSDTHPLKEKNKDTIKVVRNSNPDQNKVAQKRIDKQQKAVKNVKPSVDQQNLDTGVSKKKEPSSDKKYKGKSEQTACSPINPEEILSDSLPNDLKPSPDFDRAVNTSDKAVNKPYEKADLSTLKSNTSEERSNEIAMAMGENLSKQNIETLKKEQNLISFNNPDITVCDSIEQPHSPNIDQAEKNEEKLTNEAVNEKSKSSEDTYWNLLSTKLLKTSNDAQAFINNFELNNWKTKTINTTHALAKELIGSNMSDKQNPVESTNETSKQDNQKIPNSTDVKANTGVKSNSKEIDSIKKQILQNTEFKAHVSEDKSSAKTEEKQNSSNAGKQLKASKKVSSSDSQVKGSQPRKSKSIDFNPVKGTLNPTKSSVHNFKQNNKITKSCNDLSNNITNIHISNENQTNSNISLRKTNNNMTSNKEIDLKSGSKSKTEILKTKSTDCMLSENHENPTAELYPKEINSIVNDKNIIPEGDNKIKKLLRQFKKIQKNKSKHNLGTVKRIYSRILIDGKLKKTSLNKFQVNKEENKVHKVRRSMRTKSDQLAIDKTLSSDVPIKEKPHLSPVVETNTKALKKKINEIIINKNKLPVTSIKVLNESAKGVKVNRVDSNIFSNANRNITKHELMTDIDQPDTSKFAGHTLKMKDQYNTHRSTTKITTEFDLTKARKLHSRKEFCKPTKLQMYGVRRSIYTHSIPKAKSSQNMFNSFISENITEPNMASGSLIYVCGLTPNKQTNLHPVTTQVRNLHTTVFRSKLKKLPGKKRTTVLNGNDKTKSVNVDSAMCCVTDETTGNISKEIKLKNDPPQSAVKGLHKTCPNNSPNGELCKESSLMKDEEAKRESQSKMTDYVNKCSLKDTSNPSSLSSSVKTKIDDNTKVIFSRSERNSCSVPISSSKEDTLMDPNSNATALQRVGMNIKSAELGLNLDFQNMQSSKGNEATIISPKWKSKADRLEKWKIEVESNGTEENIKNADKKAYEGLENNYFNTQTEGINLEENNVTLETDGGKKDLSIPKSNILKNMKCSNGNMDKNNLQKDDKASTGCDNMDKEMKGKNESKMLSKDAVNILLPNPNKNISIQNKNKNKSLITIKNESTNEVDENKKTDTTKNKIKEFESKLRVLESKLKALELKSIEESNTESLLKTNAKNDTDCVNSSPNADHTTIDGNKTGIKEEIKNSEPVEINSVSQNKIKITSLTSSVKNDSKSIKKDQNDTMKEHLSQKVKTLELKLKSLETKVKDLKEKPTDSANNNKDPSKMSSLYRSSEEESKPINKPKPILNVSKLDERINHFHRGNSGQIGNLNTPNKSNEEHQNREKCGTSTIIYTKPEIYLKHYLTTNKNNVVDQIQSVKNKIISNDVMHSDNQNDSLSPKSTSTMKELNLKNNHVKSVKNVSGKILKQKPQLKYIKTSEIGEAKKKFSHVTNKIDLQQIENSQVKSGYTPATTVLHGKGTTTRKLNKEDNVAKKYVNKNVLRQKIHWASALDNNNVINVETHKGGSLSKSSASVYIPVVKKGSSKAALKTKISSLKCCNSTDDSEQKIVTISAKKIKKKSTPFNVSKKTFLKGNPYQRLNKRHDSVDSGVHITEKRNSLHEGLVKSTIWLKSVGSEQGDSLMNITDKVRSNSQTKLPRSRKSLKPPVLPKKLSKALKILKRPRKKQRLNDSKVEIRSDVDSTGSWKSVKDQVDSTSEGSSRREIENKKFNSFDYYRPKRRTYEIKHPIEKEKYSTEFLRKNENILEKFYPKRLSQNCTIHYVYSSKRNKSGRESTEFHKDSDKRLNTLISQKNPITVKSIQK